MNEKPVRPASSASFTPNVGTTEPHRYERPSVERISLDCEISSYAPDSQDGDAPLF